MIMNCLSNYSIKLREDQKWSCFGGLCGRVKRYFYSFWCSFDEIKIDLTPKKSNILYLFKGTKVLLLLHVLLGHQDIITSELLSVISKMEGLNLLDMPTYKHTRQRTRALKYILNTTFQSNSSLLVPRGLLQNSVKYSYFASVGRCFFCVLGSHGYNFGRKR